MHSVFPARWRLIYLAIPSPGAFGLPFFRLLLAINATN